MTIDFSVVSKIVQGLVLLVAGGLINRLYERRPRLVVFYGHVGLFRLQPQQQQPQGIIHTHVVVIRNTGRAAAQNVHVPHHGLLSANNIHVSIDPPLGHTVQTLPNNTEEIVFVSLPAKFQVAVSYLCFPPITFNQINGPIYSDEGTARAINVLPQTQWPRWVLAVLWALVAVGAVTVMYLLFVTMKHWA